MGGCTSCDSRYAIVRYVDLGDSTAIKLSRFDKECLCMSCLRWARQVMQVYWRTT